MKQKNRFIFIQILGSLGKFVGEGGISRSRKEQQIPVIHCDDVTITSPSVSSTIACFSKQVKSTKIGTATNKFFRISSLVCSIESIRNSTHETPGSWLPQIYRPKVRSIIVESFLSIR